MPAAMILAAGLGERMRPLTARRAKPTLPVLGASSLARLARAALAAGADALAVNAHHAPESVEAEIGRLGLSARLYVERPLMGSGGAYDAPRALLGADDVFFALNGDTLLDPPLAALAAAAREPGRGGAFLVRLGARPGRGCLELKGGLFAARHPRGSTPPAGAELADYLGAAALSRALLDFVPRGRPSDFFDEVVPAARAAGLSFAVVPFAGPCLEFTSPRGYLDHLLALVEGGAAALPGGAAAIAPGPPPRFVHEEAEADGAVFAGPASLERNARAARGATLDRAALLEGAVVEAGARLTRVIVDRGARVPRGAEFHDGVVRSLSEDEHVFHPFAD